MNLNQFKKINLPDAPGIYKFLGKNSEILYIGKATSLKDRTRSYFSSDLIKTRGMLLVDMVAKAKDIKFTETPNVLEALILEANEIKKHQPYYNTKEKDDKSFNYVYITKDFKLGTIRGRELMNSSQDKALRRSHSVLNSQAQSGGSEDSSKLYPARNKVDNFNFLRVFGPFPNGGQLKEALKIIRKFFPYIDDRRGAKGKEEFYKQIKLSPENTEENKNNIKNIILLFEGKKKKIISILKKEMLSLAKEKRFEEAGDIKKKIFALEHINDLALIKEESLHENQNFEHALRRSHSVLNSQAQSGGSEDSSKHIQNFGFRIEAYDVAHMSGKNMVGVMVVLNASPNAEGGRGEFNKKEYKKFRVKMQDAPAQISKIGGDDTGALKEILERRFNHPEWNYPNLIVVDGSTAQINIAKEISKERNLKIDIASVVKDERHKAREIKFVGQKDLTKYKKDILKINEEAHRFAITYHKQMRNKNFLK